MKILAGWYILIFLGHLSMADVELMIVKPLQLADSSIQYSLFILLTQLFEKYQH